MPVIGQSCITNRQTNAGYRHEGKPVVNLLRHGAVHVSELWYNGSSACKIGPLFGDTASGQNHNSLMLMGTSAGRFRQWSNAHSHSLLLPLRKSTVRRQPASGLWAIRC